MDFKNCDVYDGEPGGFVVGLWCPTPDQTGPATQVHMIADIPAVGRACWRFKGPGTLDRFIATLIRGRVDVFGLPDDHTFWLNDETGQKP